MTDAQVIRFIEEAGDRVKVERSANRLFYWVTVVKDDVVCVSHGETLRSAVKKCLRKCGEKFGSQWMSNKKTRPARTRKAVKP